MKAYYIKVPRINTRLTEVINKEIKIFEGKVVNKTVNYLTIDLEQSTEVQGKTHNTTPAYGRETFSNINFHTRVVQGQESKQSDYLIFDTFDKAKISKYLLLKKLGKIYNTKIEELKSLRAKNIPSDSEIEEIKLEHPELFI